jgi:hypothetical protein
MALCGCADAVANALDVVKEEVDVVTLADHGGGVTELVELVLDGKLVRARHSGE